MWYEDQGIQLLKFSMSQEVKKGPLAALTFESSKNFILTYFQKLMWFYLLATKDRLLGKVWGKTLFRCEMPWTALTQTERRVITELQFAYLLWMRHLEIHFTTVDVTLAWAGRAYTWLWNAMSWDYKWPTLTLTWILFCLVLDLKKPKPLTCTTTCASLEDSP